MRWSRRQWLQVAVSGAVIATRGGWSWADQIGSAPRTLAVSCPSNSAHSPVITAAKLHPTQPLCVAAGDDHLIRVWDLTADTIRHTLAGHDDWIRALAMAPSGDWFVSVGSEGRALQWDVDSGKLRRELVRLSQPIATVDVDASGSRVALGGWRQSVQLLDAATGEKIREFSAPDDDVRSVLFSPDGQLLAAAGRSGKICLWNVTDGSLHVEARPHKQRIRAMIFAADGTALVSAAEDGLVSVTPLSPGFSGFALPAAPTKLLSLTLYDDNRVAVGGADNLIYLWDLKTRESLGSVAMHTGSVAALDCVGQTLISAGYDATLRVWDLSRNERFVRGKANRLSARPEFRLR